MTDPSDRSKEEGGGAPSERRTKPTPVRDLAASEAPPSPAEPDVEEAEVTVEDVDWLVRVIGRSGGARASAPPLLLLGFWRASRAEGEREREALVVGRALAELTPAALRGAFRDSTAPRQLPDEDRDGPGRGRRGRGGDRGRGRRD